MQNHLALTKKFFGTAALSLCLPALLLNFLSCFRITDADESEEAEKIAKALASSRLAYEKLRQRAMVLRVAREQGWHVAKELATLQDQEEDPLLKKAMKNASRR